MVGRLSFWRAVEEGPHGLVRAVVAEEGGRALVQDGMGGAVQENGAVCDRVYGGELVRDKDDRRSPFFADSQDEVVEFGRCYGMFTSMTQPAPRR